MLTAILTLLLASTSAETDADWIIGYWATGPEECLLGESGIWFEPDGSYSDDEALGSWTFEGGRLGMTATEYPDAPDRATGMTAIFEVEIPGAGEMIWLDEEGEARSLYRCDLDAIEDFGP
ncbi:MAG: hypothetical protein ACFBQW_01420 [Sphingomonadaceae bacterium]